MRLLKTTAFRWALLYLALFGVTVAGVLAFVYWNTTAVVARQSDAIIMAELKSLSTQYRSGGLDRLLESLSERAGASTENIYLLTDFTGRPLAGNIEQIPEYETADNDWISFTYEASSGEGFEEHEARARLVKLPGGFRLLAGRDIHSLRQFKARIRGVMVLALLLALLPGLLLGFIMARSMMARIEAINRTSRAIMAGDMSERVPLTGSNDELDDLAGNLNAMLDQIGRLMTGLREVTDNIAHDLKTPLTRLHARLEDARRGDMDKKTTRKTLEQAIGDAGELISTFDTLLNIARAEAGAGREAMEIQDISLILRDVAELYEPVASDKGLKLKMIAPEGMMARIARDLLTQAIANILDNALKYGIAETGQPEILIELTKDKNNLRIDVADNGPGVPASELIHVTDRFVRLDDSRSEAGTGLGLSLAAAAARLHGGTLLLEDNNPGLRVIITLPAIS